MSVAIKFENISKQYRLGEVGTGTLSHDLHRAWAKLRGKPDPFAKVGAINDRTQPSTKNQEPGTKNDAASEYVWALKDIDFEVQQGEILGIIGRNGAGKSTLLKILSRVTAPTTGSIKAKGRIASLLEVGTGFHPELTGRENVYLNGAILGMRRHEITKQLEEIVEFSGCAKYIDTPVKRYSSGMTVRLGFAVAAHLDCEILIVDEVLAVGDAEFQKKCIGKMQAVSNDKGRTILFVSHNLAVIQQLTSYAVMLQNGCVSEIGKPFNVIKSYQKQASRDGATFADVSIHRRSVPGLNQEVSLTHLEFSGKSTNIFEADEPIFLKVTTTANASDQHFRLSLTIFRLDGSPVGSLFSQEHFHLRANASTHTTLHLKDLRLAEGHYCFGIATGKGDNTTGYVDYDVVLDALPFEVMAETSAGKTKSFWSPSWGPIRFPRPKAISIEAQL